MADINAKALLDDEQAVALVELLFFAYRDFVAEADHLLAELGFGRAHHRVLHFVGRNPGMTVAQLLDILQITKQSLSRVLKTLIEKGYVSQHEGAEDRRQRLLYLTRKGESLWLRLVAPQKQRFAEALRETARPAEDMQTLLLQLINPQNRKQVAVWSKHLNGGQH
jgi:DNA-binding MarR family transcriptional regulator